MVMEAMMVRVVVRDGLWWIVVIQIVVMEVVMREGWLW